MDTLKSLFLHALAFLFFLAYYAAHEAYTRWTSKRRLAKFDDEQRQIIEDVRSIEEDFEEGADESPCGGCPMGGSNCCWISGLRWPQQ